MTALSARVVGAKRSAIIPLPVAPNNALSAGVLIDQSDWPANATRRARLSLPGEYKAAAARQGIFSLPGSFGSDPLALVVCSRSKGNVSRWFEPIPRRYQRAAIADLAFISNDESEEWLKYFARSADETGFFSIRDAVEVRS